MLFADITIVDEDFRIREHQWVATEGERIAYIGDSAPEGDFGRVYDGADRILMPGLVNAHSHAPMTLLRGYAEGLPLASWLNDRVFPFEARFTEERALPATQLAIAEMLASGTVSFSDMYYFTDARAQAVLESGIKCNMTQGIIGFEEIPYEDTPFKAQNAELVARYHGAGDGRIRMELNIHAEYTTNPLLVRGVGEQARELGVGTHIHLSETATEHEECKARRGGLTPTRYFESLGFFEAPCTAAHGVWLEASDLEILAKHGVSVTTCPASNLKLASGVAPVPDLIAAGVNVALGTDGAASNNNLDMFAELYLLSLLHKGAGRSCAGEERRDPTVLGPAETLRIATRNGALAQGRADCGLIREGMRADLVAVRTDVPRMRPLHDALGNLAYSAHGDDVALTMVDGTVLYESGEFPTIDIERVMHDCDRIAREMATEVRKG